MMIARRGGLAALLGLMTAASVPGTAVAVVAGAARPEPPPPPVLEVNRSMNRVTRRVTKRTIRQATRPPRNRPPPAY